MSEPLPPPMAATAIVLERLNQAEMLAELETEIAKLEAEAPGDQSWEGPIKRRLDALVTMMGRRRWR